MRCVNIGGLFFPVDTRMRGLLDSFPVCGHGSVALWVFLAGESLAPTPRMLEELNFGGQCWGSQRVL